MIEHGESRQSYELNIAVSQSALPEVLVPHFPARRDHMATLAHLPEGPRTRVGNLIPAKPEEIAAIRPASDPITMKHVGIDFELLASDAREQAADKFRAIIRMGGAFDYHRQGRTPREFEALAVGSIGLDASLYFHGVEQARRMDRLMTMQQLAHRYVFDDIHLAYGNSTATQAAYAGFKEEIPTFTVVDVKYGVLCGQVHDYGEAKVGRDIPFEQKTNPAYVNFENAACIEFATELHSPLGDAGIMALLKQRVAAEEGTAPPLTREQEQEVGMYLHPAEITKAIWGTERQDNAKVARGEAFSAVERVEYVLSGIRAFEAVEHNFNGVGQDPLLAQNLLRLGVSTFFNSLGSLMEYSKKYVAVYDFLQQNQAALSRYAEIVSSYIDAQGDPSLPMPDTFIVDPFVNYENLPDNENAAEVARGKFMRTHESWKAWQDEEFLVRTVWENYFGTEHALATEQTDISFLHKTALQRNRVVVTAGQVLVARGLQEMWGVGLDRESQKQHESLFMRSVIGGAED